MRATAWVCGDFVRWSDGPDFYDSRTAHTFGTVVGTLMMEDGSQLVGAVQTDERRTYRVLPGERLFVALPSRGADPGRIRTSGG